MLQLPRAAPAPILPTTPDEQPPEDLGLIALTVAEIKRLSHWSPADTSLESTTAPDYAATSKHNPTCKCGCRSSEAPPRTAERVS
jgi:hypothetical protein